MAKKRINGHSPKELKKLHIKHLYLCGYSNSAISSEMAMSQTTVKKYVDEIKVEALAELSVQLDEARKHTFGLIQEAFRATFRKVIAEPEARFFPAMARVMSKATGLDTPPLEREDVEDMVRERVTIELKATLEVLGVSDDVIRNHTDGDTKGA